MRVGSFSLAGVLLFGFAHSAASDNPLRSLAVTDPDKFSWTILAQVVAPTAGGSAATFQTWASNSDTFSLNPRFPLSLERSVLVPLSLTAQTQILIKNGAPAKMQETRRNRSAFDFITGANGGNVLTTQAGLKEAYRLQEPIIFPDDAIEVKAIWWPVSWIAMAHEDPTHYFTGKDADGNEIALVGLHVLTKALPNWTWATFEHEDLLGRCDFMGCADWFGAQAPIVEPAQTPGGNYGTCPKSEALLALFRSASLPDVWQHYCLKGSQIDFTDATGLPTILGNSLIESPVIETSSCISCHSRATIDADGQNAYGFGGLSAAECNGLSTCSPNGTPRPQWFYKSVGGARPKTLAFQMDFVWSIPLCALSGENAAVRPGC